MFFLPFQILGLTEESCDSSNERHSLNLVTVIPTLSVHIYFCPTWNATFWWLLQLSRRNPTIQL